MTRSRNWCFTSFNLNKKNMSQIYEDNKDIIRYLCAGEEICPKTKKMHLQGWIQFERPKRFGGVKKVFDDDSIHIEFCKGTEFQNDKYCKKDGNFYETGKFITQGQRTDLENLKDDIKEGLNLDGIKEKYTSIYIRYKSGIESYYQSIVKKNSKKEREVKVICLYGETGTGKTRHAMEKADYKINAGDLKWWDGYDGEKTICIDEYHNDIKITKLLGLLDRYQQRLEVKGGFTYAQWDTVYITSNFHPKKWHLGAEKASRKALLRRFHEIREMK